MTSNRFRPTPIQLAALTLTTAICLAGMLALGVAQGIAGGAGCAGARSAPGQLSLRELRSATVCVINRMRALHGLGALNPDASLGKAAQHHSSDMVRNDYFSHDSPSGSTIQTRIGRSGYLAGAHSYTFGEIIGGGTARNGSPKAVVRAWMHSATHRAEILDGAFHDLGVGAMHGFPGRGSHGATFTVDFGKRS